MASGLFGVPVMETLCFYTCVLALKMLLMSVLTSKSRIAKGAFANPEDAKGLKGKVRIDDDVERVRRAHLNDLENIPVFIIVCTLYLLTNPSVFLATTLIRVYAIVRIMHTLVYAVVVVPQPARGLAWGIGYFITIFMAVKTLLHFVAYM